MKKEMNLKKVLSQALIGFPLGVTLLMISYVCIYFIAGESAFYIEISQLQNIKTLIFQMGILGLIYYIVTLQIYTFSILNNKKFTWKSMIISILVWFITTIVIMSSLTENIFSKNIAIMNLMVLVVVYAICIVYTIVKCVIENKLVKEINNKLKNNS